MRALRARYLRLWRNRYAAFQAVDICRKRQSIFAPYGASESGFEIIIYMCTSATFNFQLSSYCRRARTKTYVTETEPTRSPYMRPYPPSGSLFFPCRRILRPLPYVHGMVSDTLEVFGDHKIEKSLLGTSGVGLYELY